MAAITTKFPRILIESQRLNKYSTCKMMSGSAAVGTPGEGAGKGGGSGGKELLKNYELSVLQNLRKIDP